MRKLGQKTAEGKANERSESSCVLLQNSVLLSVNYIYTKCNLTWKIWDKQQMEKTLWTHCKILFRSKLLHHFWTLWNICGTTLLDYLRFSTRLFGFYSSWSGSSFWQLFWWKNGLWLTMIFWPQAFVALFPMIYDDRFEHFSCSLLLFLLLSDKVVMGQLMRCQNNNLQLQRFWHDLLHDISTFSVRLTS